MASGIAPTAFVSRPDVQCAGFPFLGGTPPRVEGVFDGDDLVFTFCVMSQCGSGGAFYQVTRADD